MYYTYARTYIHRCVAAIVAGRFFSSPKCMMFSWLVVVVAGMDRTQPQSAVGGGGRSFDISTIIFAAVRRRVVGGGVLSCPLLYCAVL